MVRDSTPVVDAWMQHPTPEFLNHEMFASIRRWQGDEAVPEIPDRPSAVPGRIDPWMTRVDTSPASDD